MENPGLRDEVSAESALPNLFGDDQFFKIQVRANRMLFRQFDNSKNRVLNHCVSVIQNHYIIAIGRKGIASPDMKRQLEFYNLLPLDDCYVLARQVESLNAFIS